MEAEFRSGYETRTNVSILATVLQNIECCVPRVEIGIAASDACGRGFMTEAVCCAYVA